MRWAKSEKKKQRRGRKERRTGRTPARRRGGRRGSTRTASAGRAALRHKLNPGASSARTTLFVPLWPMWPRPSPAASHQPPTAARPRLSAARRPPYLYSESVTPPPGPPTHSGTSSANSAPCANAHEHHSPHGQRSTTSSLSTLSHPTSAITARSTGTLSLSQPATWSNHVLNEPPHHTQASSSSRTLGAPQLIRNTSSACGRPSARVVTTVVQAQPTLVISVGCLSTNSLRDSSHACSSLRLPSSPLTWSNLAHRCG